MSLRRLCSLLALVIAALLGFGSPQSHSQEPIESKSIDANKLFGDAQVAKIEIFIAEDDWNKLRVQKREFVDSMIDPNQKPFDTFSADLKIDGFEIKNVGIRKKGFFGSLDDDFPSLRIKVDEFVEQSPLGSLKRLTLNNNKQDAPLLSQFMAYEFFNRIGLVAPRVGFVTLYVNDKHLGLYSQVESVDKVFLKNRFGSGSGDLWEGTLADFSPKSVKRLEWKSGGHEDSNDWKVARLAEILQQKEVDLEAIGKIVDLDSFYRFWAAESLLSFWDGYCSNQNNFFVYDDPKTEMLHFMPWGADSLWSTMTGPFGGFSRPVESIYLNSVLPYRLFSTESGQTKYREALTELLDHHWNEVEMTERIEKLSETIKPHLHKRQSGATAGQRAMKRFIETRRKRVARELESWPVELPPKSRRPMYVNEVGMAKGDFSTFWSRVPKGQSSKGTVAIELDGKTFELREPKVSSRRFSFGFMGMAVPQDSLPAVIEIIGKGSDDETCTLSLTVETKDFEGAKNQTVNVRGSFSVGNAGAAGPFGGPNMKWIQGTCVMTESGTSPGTPVIGSFEAKFLQLKGGFFER
jgi:spore coat protein CotH